MNTEPASKVLFIGTHEDIPYLGKLKGLMGTTPIAGSTESISTLYEVTSICKKRNFTAVLTTSSVLLQKLVGYSEGSEKKPSIDNYAGSYFKQSGIEFVILDPLAQLISTNYGEFITRRFISKFTAPKQWRKPSTFNWHILTPANAEELYEQMQDAYAIAIDIETRKEPPSITSISYTALYLNGTSLSIVFPLESMYYVSWMRKFNSLPAPKIFQNGKYDISYLSMYDAVPYNYLWDTANLFHSWYSELPKDLAFLQAFFVREAAYWKDLAKSNDPKERLLYNAKDTWATAEVFLAAIAEMPAWAIENYKNEFPLVFPCHLSEMIGLARDMEELKTARLDLDSRITNKTESLRKMLGAKTFNPNSPVQVKKLLHVLGCKDINSTEEKELKKAALRHPLNSRIINLILDIRGDRKLVSTYLRMDTDKKKLSDKGAKEYYGFEYEYPTIAGGTPESRAAAAGKKGRILYALNPHGTDTGRLASKEHHFWTGLQIQNIPRGIDVKRTIIADDGFVLGECDLEQAESRDTAYISGDENLINAVTGTRDFHSVNASAFFGVSYDGIYDSVARKTKNKQLRDLAKRVNHGANYNMGPDVLVDTMGEDKIYEAARILKLPRFWTARQIAEFLLKAFHKTYPKIAGTYYPGVVNEIITTCMLASKAIHDSPYQASKQGLTRYCFGHPNKNKRDLNSYVAHPPQSLNAMTLNKAYMRVFYEIALSPIHSNNFRLHAQIHDSILFSFRIGHEYLCELVRKCMEIPVTITAYDKKTRTFIVPAAIKAGADGKGSHRWSEVE